MKTDNLNIRIEPDIKKSAETTLNDLGLTMAEAVKLFLKQVIMTESIPFEIKKPKFNKETEEAIQDALLGKNLSKSYTSTEEMWKDIEEE